jgi:hypothetical protein
VDDVSRWTRIDFVAAALLAVLLVALTAWALLAGDQPYPVERFNR